MKEILCKLAKETWNNLKSCYEGDAKLKERNLQNYKGHFESLKMEYNENILSNFLQLDNIFNSIIDLTKKSRNLILLGKY